MKSLTNNKQSSGITFEELSKLVQELKLQDKPIITLKDMVLFLLYAQKDKPIYSRILMFKEIFLLYEEVLKQYEDKMIIENPRFEPYKYGPYSFKLADLLDQLYWAGLIEIRGRRNTRREAFYITNEGIKEIKEKFERLPSELREKIIELRKGWDQLGVDGILRYVYQKYPTYKKESKLKNKYKVILWGGKG